MRQQYEHADEKTLIKGCVRGREAAQKALYERYSSRMMGVCYRYVRNHPDAEDVLQEGFIKVFKNIEQFNGNGSLEGWIRRIMVRSAINFLNKNKFLLANADQVLIENTLQEDNTPDNKEDDKLIQLLNKLPEGYKMIVNLHAIEGYSHKEIGEMLGITESTSRSQYSRAKDAMIKLNNQAKSMQTLDK